MIYIYKIKEICNVEKWDAWNRQDALDWWPYPVYSSSSTWDWILWYRSKYDYAWEYLTRVVCWNAWTIFKRNWKFSMTNSCWLLNVLNKNLINQNYLYYYLTAFAKNYVNYQLTMMPKLKKEDMCNIDVHFPKDISKQEEIINILDKMSDYCNNINDWLEKELNLREKQYKYYLNKLLTF